MGRLGAILPILLALVIAAVASFYLYQWMGNKPAKPGEQVAKEAKLTNIAVAEMDLPWGTKLKPEMVKYVPFLDSSLPPGHFSQANKLVERVLILPVKKGEPILESRLAPVDVISGGVAAVVGPGKRAQAVKGDKVIGVSGFVKPGNRVDVLASITNKGESREGDKEMTKVVLENVRVLATGEQVEESSGGKPQPVDVYTLEVSPEEGEKLALAATHGKLHFALRNTMDDKTVLTEGATVPDMLTSFTPGRPMPVEAKPEIKVTQAETPVTVPVPPRRLRVETIKGTKQADIEFQSEYILGEVMGDMRIWSRLLRLVLLVLILTPMAAMVTAEASAAVHKPSYVQLNVGRSLVLPANRDVTRVSVADPTVADFVVLSPTQVYITGKSAGLTSLTIWFDQDFQIYELEVKQDLTLIKRRLHDLFPGEKNIRVFANDRSLTLSGSVSNASRLAEVLQVAQAFVPEGHLVNLLEVAGDHQVLLEVKVAEMSKSVQNRLGINFQWAHGAELGLSMMGALATPPTSGSTANFGDLLISPNAGGLARFNSGASTWTGIFDVLRANGLAKILAEPTLIAISGQTATFLAGGEFPVPVPNENGITIDFKKFGVQLDFTPTVLKDNRISIKVAPEVSEIDSTLGVNVAGTAVPGLSTRRTSTMVELGDGQSFAIAGLLRDVSRETYNKFPGLGDIPILGALFKSASFQRNETELVIIVTPHLAKPLDMTNQTLPTDSYTEPSDAEFFLWGVWGKSSNKNNVELDGKFGHIYTEK